jgi:diguanylate cyclase (GGDEF)-like protein
MSLKRIRRESRCAQEEVSLLVITSKEQMENDNDLKARVLFLDDETNYLEGVRRSLRYMQDEWDMRFFSCPKDTLLAIEEMDDTVVVTDWLMPEMDGLRFLEAAKQKIKDKNTANGYFIALTGKEGVEDLVEALDRGFDDFVRKPFHTDELVARVRVGIRVLKSERELKTANAKLELLATMDPLTGLTNRRHGIKVFEAEISKVRRSKHHLSVIMADIDHLKKINDAYGEEVGDRVLVRFAGMLRSSMQNFDVSIRWGGEEFLIICPHTTSKEVEVVANRLIDSVRKMKITLPDSTTIQITVSLGTASTDVVSTDNAHDPIVKADNMLCLAKMEGRDRAMHYKAAHFSTTCI